MSSCILDVWLHKMGVWTRTGMIFATPATNGDLISPFAQDKSMYTTENISRMNLSTFESVPSGVWVICWEILW